ncbi:MAG: AI-2E family transporter [Planctomycetaceae bacterium]|nr:AI-2E family transporter [Planctomycetaceae bacterium]
MFSRNSGESLRSMPRLVSLAVMLALIVILGITFFQVVAPFLLPLFLAGMTAVVCQPLFRYFLHRTEHRIPLSAGLATATILAAIMVPMIVGTTIASLQLYTFANRLADNDQWREMISDVTAKAGSRSSTYFERAVEFGNSFLPDDRQRDPENVAADMRKRLKEAFSKLGDRSLGLAAGSTFGILSGAVGTIVTILVGIMIYGIAVYYFFADGTELIASAEKLIPVHAEYQRELLLEFAKVVRSVVLATFLAALAQGFATTLALWILGFHHVFVLFVLAAFAALIPLAGTWLVWVPCAVILFMQGHWPAAVFLSLYGAMFVGFLDNVIRTWVLNSDTKLHPLLAFISVLGGIQAMGLWGVFIGPIVVSCLHALVKIFNHELFQLSLDRRHPPTAALISTRESVQSVDESEESAGAKTPLTESKAVARPSRVPSKQSNRRSRKRRKR